MGFYRFRNGHSPQSGSVAVTVTDADENPLAAREVAVFANDQDTGKRGITGEDGVVSFELLEDDYRFRVEDGGQSFWNSGEETDCSIPGCDSVTVELSYADVLVTVTDENGAAQAQALVLGFDGNRFAGAQALTNELGQATLAMPAGGRYRVRADLYGQFFWSGEENTCRLPACTEMSVELQTPQNLAIQQAITYTYDPLNRLTAAEIDTGLYFHYTYDAVGNRLEEAKKLDAALDEIVNTYAYDAGNRLASTNGVAATWDANGNLLDDGQYTYGYDSANHLIADDQGAYRARYTYNGLGDRVSQTANGVTTQYTLDLNSGLTQVLTENTPGGYGDETYLYGLARLAQVSAESTDYFVADALGSVRQLTDAGANVTLQRSYTPYGEILQTSGTGDTHYAFTGESYDPQTGLTYLRARTYSAGQGRFISQDTWAGDANLPLSYNRWAYGYDNPVRFTDPSGFCSDEDADGQCDFPSDPISISINVNLASSIPINKLNRPAQYYYYGGREMYNLCGHISLTMIYETISHSSNTLDMFVSSFNKDTGTGYEDLQNMVVGVFPQNWIAKAYSGQTVLARKSGSQMRKYLPLPKNWYIGKNNTDIMNGVIMRMLERGHFIIAGVILDKNSGLISSHDPSPETSENQRYVKHWVVVTGFLGGFVEINNPFANRVEKISWGEFNLSVKKSMSTIIEIYRYSRPEDEIDLASEAQEYKICP